MEKNVRMAILFDYYGELLTEKQKEYFDLYYGENLSLSEIAENDGISRQGVRDVIVRAESIMEDAEAKLGILCGSLISAIVGCVLLNKTLPKE